VNTISTSQAGLQELLEASRALNSELSLDALLQRLVETAAALTASKYAALGVIDRTGTQLERFITHGIDVQMQAAIGDLPRGRGVLGVLGVLIREATPLILHDLHEDPRSVGFPPGHPPMKTFLGVPIMLRGVAYGNLYLTEKAGSSDFTDHDLQLVIHLASQAAVAIENARLFEASSQWSRQLESLNEIGNALATETDLSRLLDLVTARLRDLIEARLVTILVPIGPEQLRVEAAAGDGGEGFVGEVVPIATSKSGRVFERRRSERVDSIMDDPEVSPEMTRRLAARSGLWVPLIARGRAIGVIGAYDKAEGGVFADVDMRLAETFANRAAIAIDLSQRVERDALRRTVAAQEAERQHLARELHDETGQALTSILLGLSTLEDTERDEAGRAAVARVRELVVHTLQGVRQLAVDLRPKILDGRGFDPASVRDEGFGLQGMRERVALLGGTTKIESRKGAGTTLKVEVPAG